MKLKKCVRCGAMVEVMQDCTCEDCGIKCCGQEMIEVCANSVDALFEKHVPQVEVCGNYVVVTVNHVMEPEHFIEWVAYEDDATFGKKLLRAGCEAKAIFPYAKGSTIYAYCNKHGLWSKVVE